MKKTKNTLDVPSLDENLLFTDFENLEMSKKETKKLKKVLENPSLGNSTEQFFQSAHRINQKLQANDNIFTLEDLEF